jgi:hypothetical protein
MRGRDQNRGDGLIGEEGQERCAMVQDCLRQTTPGRRMDMDAISRFYTTMMSLTSGMTLQKLAIFFKASIRLVQNGVVHCVHELVESLSQRFLSVENASDIQPVAIFADFPNAFGVVDASPISIQRPHFNQKDYYSRK